MAKLKAWDDPDWQRKLSKTLTVSRIDEDIPTGKLRNRRKPWSVALTRESDQPVKAADIDGLPAGNTILLSEHEVLALVEYLLEPQTALWFEGDPDITAPGEYEVEMYVQPGMVAITESGTIVNGEGRWSPEYFKRAEPIEVEEGMGRPTRKVHTLPWPRRHKGQSITVTISDDDVKGS